MNITLGAEEELQTICENTGALVEHSHDGLETEGGAAGTMTTEIHRCVIELQTRVCHHPDEVVAALASLREAASARAARQGQRVLASGVHPFSQWEDQALFEGEHHPHYDHLLHEYGDIARSALSFGMHVHLGLPEMQFRMPVMNALRHVLPEILALSLSAPFFAGRDTGLQSWRHCLLGRYPRMGIPEIWESDTAYIAHLERLRSTGCIEFGHGLWEDMRLHHRYGTIEVRIADALPCLDRIWLIVALLQCEARTLLEQARAGTLPAFWSRHLIEENKWRVRRHGQEARLVDWTGDVTRSMHDRFALWFERLRPAAQALGYADELHAAIERFFKRNTFAHQYRALHKESSDWSGFALALAQQTQDSAIAARLRFGVIQ